MIRNHLRPLLLLAVLTLPSQTRAQLVNGTFEQVELGRPIGWTVPAVAAEDGWAVEARVDGEAGARGVVLYRESDQAPQTFGNLMQTLDVAAIRGRRFRLEAKIDFFEPAGSALRMWARVDRPDGARGFFDNMADRPVQEPGSRTVTINGDVAEDAVSMSVGFMIQGGAGRALVTSVRLTPLAPVGTGARGPADLTAHAAERVGAFLRLAGLVRYFHPSDESLEADWLMFRIAGVDIAESVQTPEALADSLAKLFAPVAPTVQVWSGGASDGPPPAPLPASEELVAIRHRGLGPPLFETSTGPNIYSSERLREPRQSSAGDIPRPPFASVVELGGGVWARVPHVLPVDEEGTLPQAQGRVAHPERADGWVADWRDRSFRLAAVGAAWNVLEHFYPYWDVVDVNWDEVLHLRLGEAAVRSGDDHLGDVLERLVADARDGHGNLLRAQAVKGFLPARATWLGDEAVIHLVADDTPLQPGDTLLAIEGTSIETLYAQAAERISASTEGWLRHKAEMHLMAGPPADARPGGPTETVRVRQASGEIVDREVHRIDPQNWFQLTPERPGLAAEVAPGIHYVDLDRLAWEDLEPHLEVLAAADGVIFDLRGYPGTAGSRILPHLSTETIHSAYWRVPTWIRPGLEHAEYQESRWTLAPATPHLGGRIVFLTGPGAISYAESCMAIVEAYGLGEIVGERTAGTNGNINRVALPGGFQMIWTGMRVVKHDGQTVHQGVGVTPTIPLTPTVEGLAAGRDELLERAIEVVNGG